MFSVYINCLTSRKQALSFILTVLFSVLPFHPHVSSHCSRKAATAPDIIYQQDSISNRKEERRFKNETVSLLFLFYQVGKIPPLPLLPGSGLHEHSLAHSLSMVNRIVVTNNSRDKHIVSLSQTHTDTHNHGSFSNEEWENGCCTYNQQYLSQNWTDRRILPVPCFAS